GHRVQHRQCRDHYGQPAEHTHWQRFRNFLRAICHGHWTDCNIRARRGCRIDLVGFRRDLHTTTTDPAIFRAIHTHRPLLIKTLVVTAAVLAGFLAGYNTALVAVAGSAALLVTRRVRPRKVYAAIDWDLLMLFIGLFVVVGAGERAGIDRMVLDVLRPLGVA